jgi:hypothetical protein
MIFGDRHPVNPLWSPRPALWRNGFGIQKRLGIQQRLGIQRRGPDVIGICGTETVLELLRHRPSVFLKNTS